MVDLVNFEALSSKIDAIGGSFGAFSLALTFQKSSSLALVVLHSIRA